jgi:hypothetical protein
MHTNSRHTIKKTHTHTKYKHTETHPHTNNIRSIQTHLNYIHKMKKTHTKTIHTQYKYTHIHKLYTRTQTPYTNTHTQTKYTQYKHTHTHAMYTNLMVQTVSVCLCVSSNTSSGSRTDTKEEVGKRFKTKRWWSYCPCSLAETSSQSGV